MRQSAALLAVREVECMRDLIRTLKSQGIAAILISTAGPTCSRSATASWSCVREQ